MYQPDLFHMTVRCTAAKFLGSGCFSKAYLMPNGTVVKVGSNDGTRNWLEFCAHHTAAGTLMDYMPTVYKVVGLEGGMYVATMDRYWPSDYLEIGGESERQRRIMVSGAAYAYYAYIEAIGAVGEELERPLNDLHERNIMQDDAGKLILIDPSGGAYTRPGTQGALFLH